MTTLETLTDMVAALQRQINDISSQLAGQEQTIEGHSTEISDLQDPPVGVPPEFLEWLDSHGVREVDTRLDTDLNSLSDSVTGHTADISSLSDRVDAEETARIEQDTNINDSDADLQTQITDNLATLTQEIVDRSALSVTVSESIGTVNDRVDDIQTDLDAVVASGITTSTSLSNQVASHGSAIQTAQTQILLLQGTGVDPLGAQASQITALTTLASDASTGVAQEITDRTNADAVLQSSLSTLSSSVSTFNSGLNNERSDRMSSDSALASDIAVVSSEVSGHGGLIAAETASRVAADATLTTAASNNEDDIVVVSNQLDLETTLRTDADTALQVLVDANTVSNATHTATLATHDTKLTAINSRFSVVKDVGGYVTGWRVIDETASAGAFKLATLNNDVKLQNTGYAGKYIIPVSAVAFTPNAAFDTDWGGVTTNDFTGTDANNYTRNVVVFGTTTVGINKSIFKGNDQGTGGSLQRLGQVLTTFKVDFSGYVNGYLSMWYRIKPDPTGTTQRWLPVADVSNNLPSSRDYEFVRGQAVVQISVAVDSVIEFGLAGVKTLDASMTDTTKDFIYGSSASVVALNMVTIS